MAERAKIVRCLVEGDSLRSTSRITRFARNTSPLLVDLGEACAEYRDRALRGLACDEIWPFVYAKDRKRAA